MSTLPAKRWRRAEFAVPIAGIILLALAVRALALLRTDPVAFDSARYFEMAALMRAGHWAVLRASDFPPLYPALVAAGQSLGVSAAAAGLFVSLAADLLVVLPLAAVAYAAAGEVAAWAAAFLWAIHPYAVRLGVQALSDAPAALLVGLAMCMGLRAMDSGRIAWALGAGVASGLAYLARPEGLEPALALAALYALRAGRFGAQGSTSEAEDPSAPGPRPPAPTGRALRAAAWALAPLLGWAAVASPYVAAISADAGAITLSKKKSPTEMLRSLASPIGGQHPATASPAANPPAKGEAARAPRPWRRPGLIRNGYLFQRPLVNGIHPLVLALGVIGAFALWRTGPGAGARSRELLAGLCGLHLAVLIALAASREPDYLGGHHFFLMVLYILPFAGAGLARAVAWGTDRLRAPRAVPAVAVALLVAVMVPQSALRRPERGTGVRPAAEWIRAQAAGTPVVVTDLAKLTYYAGARRLELLGAYDDILRLARANAAHFVAFYPDLVAGRSPDFLARLNPADLELVRTFPEPSRSDPGRRLEIYRIKTK